MSELLVKVGKPGEFFCQMRAHRVSAGRAYDFQAWTQNDAGAWHWSTVTVCANCRGHFGRADREADAAEMPEQVTEENLPRLLASVKMRPYHDQEAEDAARDQMRERMAEERDGSRWLDPVSRHLTFPHDVER